MTAERFLDAVIAPAKILKCGAIRVMTNEAENSVSAMRGVYPLLLTVDQDKDDSVDTADRGPRTLQQRPSDVTASLPDRQRIGSIGYEVEQSHLKRLEAGFCGSGRLHLSQRRGKNRFEAILCTVGLDELYVT